MSEQLQLPKVPRRKRLVGPELEAFASQVVAKYRRPNVSIRQICAETGRSYGAIHRILVDAGVTLRKHGGVRTGQRRKAMLK
ncbi:helix-turn-helix domain-containing protein [Streptomyces scopuliridis]|uniref:helix-turn-helix domain-containing protein n=1 Tax=Streptomyces scopuliridis TaxID=452529 RepID=UPI00368063F8